MRDRTVASRLREWNAPLVYIITMTSGRELNINVGRGERHHNRHNIQINFAFSRMANPLAISVCCTLWGAAVARFDESLEPK